MEKYQHLAPTDNITKCYAFDAFDYAMGVSEYEGQNNSNKILNIAVTGPYGAGKSSIVMSYFKKNPKFRPLYLSMAKFNIEDNCACGEKKQTKELDEREIEQWIIQQLLFQKKPSSLPYSRMTRIKNFSSIQLLGSVTLLLFAFISFSSFYSAKAGGMLIDDFYLWWHDLFKIGFYPQLEYLSNLIVIPLLAFFLWCILKFVKKINISRIVFKDTEISMGEKESLINKYLDELLYFFQCTDHEVIIFEDLDRLGAHSILTKLRELNKIVNSSESIKRNIKFIYVLNDDIFKSADRVKFFDFIIPIIPVINSHNVGDYLQKEIEKIEPQFLAKFDENYFYNIATWMKDIRILKNTINEFIVYQNALEIGQQTGESK